MPTVKMVGHITGTRDGVDWPAAGGLLEVDSVEAEHLVAARLAELVDDAKPSKAAVVEVAMAEPEVETAATASRKRRA